MSRSQSPLRPRAGETTREWYLRSRSSEDETMADFFRRVNRQTAENRAAATVTVGGKTIEQYNAEMDDMERSVEQMQHTAEQWVAVTGYDEANRRFREMPAGARADALFCQKTCRQSAWRLRQQRTSEAMTRAPRLRSTAVRSPRLAPTS